MLSVHRNPNLYTYVDGNDLNGRISVYGPEMKAYDLSALAIRNFADAIKRGNLRNLRLEFAELNDQQKRGLLNLYLNYNNIFGNGLNLNAPHGIPTDMAKHFGHQEIVDFLVVEKIKISV